MLLIADLSGWGDPLSSLHRHDCMFSHTAHYSKHTARSTEAELVALAEMRGCEAHAAHWWHLELWRSLHVQPHQSLQHTAYWIKAELVALARLGACKALGSSLLPSQSVGPHHSP